MFRRDGWAEGFFSDNMIKFECRDCGRTFIVGEEMKKECPPGFPVCPYCGQNNVDDIVWTTDENLEEMDLGCIGLYIDTSEEGRKTMTLDELDLSVRTYNCLMRAGITTVDKISNMKIEEIRKVRNLSLKCVEEIQGVMKANGLKFREGSESE